MKKEVIKNFTMCSRSREDYILNVDAELNHLPSHMAVDERFYPALFRSRFSLLPDVDVVEGITNFTDDELENNLLGCQGVIAGCCGKGMIGQFVFRKNSDPNKLETVSGFEFLGKFDLADILSPDEPFVQLRLIEQQEGAYIFGDVHMTAPSLRVAMAVLAGGYTLQSIAHRSILGYLPGDEFEER